MKLVTLLTVGLSSLFLYAVPSYALSNTEIKQRIIQESIAEYPGNCACPYNRAKNGSSCGKRSAYSRGGGYAPLCFAQDVTDQMVQDWKKRNGQ